MRNPLALFFKNSFGNLAIAKAKIVGNMTELKIPNNNKDHIAIRPFVKITLANSNKLVIAQAT